MPEPPRCFKHSQKCFSLPIRCVNCGAREAHHFEYGKRVVDSIRRPCERCGFEGEWQVVRE